MYNNVVTFKKVRLWLRHIVRGKAVAATTAKNDDCNDNDLTLSKDLAL